MNLAEAEAKLAEWIAADSAASKGSSYSIGDMSLTRADAPFITSKINYWQKVVNEIKDVDSGRQSGVRVASWN